MFSNGIIRSDLSFFIPSGSRYPTKPVQKLWTDEEVKKLLGFVDRADAKGKRDYALMLLVVRYGVRAGDILNLKLSNINRESMVIRFCQAKTSVVNTLPILDDVGWALADWITNARPKQASTNHVFTRLTAPYCEMKDLGGVFKSHMAIAGIVKSVCAKSGPHSLRHALASNMLAGSVPLPVITTILGHSSSSSTMVYLHSDIENLRQCALDAEEVCGV
jgi:integrase